MKFNLRYNLLLFKASYFYKSGKLDEAEKVYKDLLQINPDDTNVLNLYSMLCLSKGEATVAVDLLSKALILNENPIIMSNLAKAYYMAGDVQNSIKFDEKVASIEPTDDIFYSLGNSYKKADDYEKAVEAYNKALEINPDNFNVLYNLAVLYKEQKKYHLALITAIRAELVNEKNENIQFILYKLYKINWKYNEALHHLKKAYKLNPKQYLYLHNQGVLQSKLGKNREAIKCYKKILRQNPKHVATILNLAVLYKDFDKNECLKYLELAYSLRPKDEEECLLLAITYRELCFNEKSIEILKGLNSAMAYSLMGENMLDLARYEKALTYFDMALNLENNSVYLIGKSYVLKYLGKIHEAKVILEKIEDKSIQAKTALGKIYLQEKNFEKGMKLYTKTSFFTGFYTIFKKKNIWESGENLTDKTILIFSDCGFGDTIMFARYIPFLQKIAKKVIVQTNKELVSLIKQNFSNIEVYNHSKKNISYDIVMPFMDIAYALNMNFDNIPFSDGYLHSNNSKIKSNKLKVGIFYQGNKHILRERSIPFEEIKRINSDKIQLYSFQIADYQKEDNSVINLRNKIKNYSDTARLLKSMDLLITVDSSIAHCAGALGVKTFLLLPYTADWRWFNDDYSTPWYKSIRIFKQTSPNDWKGVIDRVIEELK